MNRDKAYFLLTVLLLIAAGGIVYIKRQRQEQPEPNENTTMSQIKENYAKTALSPNFKLSEFACKDGTQVPEKYIGNVQLLMNNLQALRAELGLPIHINSGYRTDAYNKSVGGKPDSAHRGAMAADITVIGKSPAQVKAAIEKLIKAGKMHNGGIGLYKTFVHYDICGPRRW